MSQPAPLDPQLFRLFWAACDDSATPEQLAQLEHLVSEDDRVLKGYVQFMAIHSNLTWQSQTRETPAESLPAAAMPHGFETAEIFVPTPLPTRASGQSLSGSRVSAIWSILGVAFVFYGLFTLVAWNLRSGNIALETAELGAVATASDSDDVTWSPESKPEVAATGISHAPLLLQPNKPLEITFGSLEVTLKGGVSLRISAPAKWSIVDRNRALLESGKLIATVPSRAIGFILDTPNSRIVDLGTEFGVEVGADGATEVEVLKGSIELQNAPNDSKTAPRTEKLNVGEARRVERQSATGQASVRKIAPRHATVPSTRPREIVVDRVTASSTYASDRLLPGNLIAGSGLVGEKHSAEDKPGCYWHTGFGRVKDEFLIFELHERAALTSMLVWNYNQPGFLERGLQVADIYVSDSGAGDPLSKPTEWRRVLAEQKFRMAPGNSDYDDPDVIFLEKAPAKFVAIVISDTHQMLPAKTDGTTEPAAETRCVGLSEVLFKGVPLPAN